MQDIVGQSTTWHRRHRWSAPDGDADSVAKVFSDDPEASMVVIGDFAPGVTETTLEPETGFNVFDFPSIEDSDPSVVGGGDLRQVRRQRGCGRVPRVPDDDRGSRDLGGARWVLVAEQGSRRGALSGRDHEDDGRRARGGRDVPLRPLRPPAGRIRRHSGPGPVRLFSDFVANPNDIDKITRQMEVAATAAFK